MRNTKGIYKKKKEKKIVHINKYLFDGEKKEQQQQ